MLKISRYITGLLQVLLVTGGGRYSVGQVYLDSTEVLEAGTWRITGPLPSARAGLRAVSVDNRIFIFGEICFYYIEDLYINIKSI